MEQSSRSSVKVSAIIAAYDRLEATRQTLDRIQACVPPPDEILLHIDGDRNDLAEAIQSSHPHVKQFVSHDNIGPGGGRNTLINNASHELIASFDDDSFPQAPDYFARLLELERQFPDTVIFASAISERCESDLASPPASAKWVADFVGCGCTYRRAFFKDFEGYVPLPIAYGMEEADLALRIHARGGRIRYSPELRIYHDTDLGHHCTPRIACLQLANTALLPFLRYPLYLFPIALFQFARKLWDTLRRGRLRGALLGVIVVVPHLLRHRKRRQALPGRIISSFLALRRHPIVVDSKAHEAY